MSALPNRLASILSRNWWVLLLRGLAAIAFGVLAWYLPGASLAALVLLFGVYALADGILGAWTAISGRKEHDDWWVLLLWALVGIGAGILTFVAPGITALALVFYIAVWSIATGVLEIVAAIRLRKEITGEWMLVLAGIISVVFGILLLAQPGAGALALVWLIATYAVIFGIVLVILAFKVRGFAGRVVHA
ncbi:MAG TPA: HdeD family acid-resistance protein [Burkholderiaceae bacterium]|nr:HdeD family acid-resistance protein [Burkholderiaceae bacterium]